MIITACTGTEGLGYNVVCIVSTINEALFKSPLDLGTVSVISEALVQIAS